MKVLIILENFYPRVGGVETLFYTLVHELDRQGHEVNVLTNLYDPNLAKAERIGNYGLIIRKRYLSRYIFTFFAWWHAIGLARKADIIHTTSYNAAVPARLAAIITGTPSIITFHERWGDLWDRLPWMSSISKSLHKRFEAWICGFKFDRFVAVSDFTKDSLIKGGVEPHRITRIYNGIDYADFPKHMGSTRGKYTFLYYGRLGYAKGVDLLLKAYHDLLDGRKDHRLVMVIPSEKQPTTKHVKKMISDLNLSDHIEIHQDLPYQELKDKIASVDAVVIPSYSEGFCFAAAETMAIGTPIISSGQGALKEVVGGKFITIESCDVKGLRDGMINALDGSWNQSIDPRFELSDTVSAYLEIYESLKSS